MGQYWIPVNLDKCEFINPHKLGCGMKLCEQFGTHPGTGAALLILMAAFPESRGGGDPEPDPVIGRWAGNRIVIIGDYAENSDLKRHRGDLPASLIYSLCQSPENWLAQLEYLLENHSEKLKGVGAKVLRPFTDITDDVCRVIERELNGTFIGEGVGRDFTPNIREKDD